MQHHSVYHVHDRRMGLVYVGIAQDFESRWRQHQRFSWWFPEVDVTEVRVYVMGNRQAAREMEAAAIARCRPRYNIAQERPSLAAYLANAERLDDIPDPWPVLRTGSWRPESQLEWDVAA